MSYTTSKLGLIRVVLSCLLILLTLLYTIPAHSQAEEASGSFSFIFENDVFYGTDRNYTNGVKFIWIPANNSNPPEWASKASQLIPWFPKNAKIRHGYAFGQSIFTPDDITLSDPPKGDHPYAGWLYTTLGLASESKSELDLITFTIGIVGPATLAEDTQSFVHKMIGSDDPMGWDTQLSNELGIVLTHKHIWRGIQAYHFGRRTLDMSVYNGGALGNVLTYANAGVTFRYGKNLPEDFGPPKIQLGIPSEADFGPAISEANWYLFLGLEGQVIARNIFLDGNSFVESRSVVKNPLVADAQLGLVFDWKEFRIGYTHVFRTKEFKSQRNHSNFGSLTIGVDF